MHSKPEFATTIVCPDDLGPLELSREALQCLLCGRHFNLSNGIPELLPREAYDPSSTTSLRLNIYGKSFSDRPDKAWQRPLREVLNRLGNGYLYSWAGRALDKFSHDRCLSILDAGCGEGILGRYLSSRHHYVGIDFSVRPLLRASRYNPAPYFR